jgi:hypothetical protein
MLFALEAAQPEPSATPEDPALAALSLILEDYGDEWLNKCMFQQRWGNKPDRDQAGLRALVQLSGGKRPRAWKKPSVQIAERMADRLPLVGASAENQPVLDASWRRFAELAEHAPETASVHFRRPSGLRRFQPCRAVPANAAGPDPGRMAERPRALRHAWCENMDDPKAGGPFADMAALEPTLAPLFAEEVGKTYLPWAKANADAVRAGEGQGLRRPGRRPFVQSAQKHAAEAFNAVDRHVSRTLKDSLALEDFLSAANCLQAFRHAGKRPSAGA